MATLTLDNKIYQAYASIAEQNNISITDAMKEALRLLRLHLKKPQKSFLRKRLEERVDELRALPVNWDSAEAPALSSLACNFTAKVLAACDDKMLQGLAIFPNTNGGVLMQWQTSKGDACLSILDDKFVYDISYGETEEGAMSSFSELNGFVAKLKHIV